MNEAEIRWIVENLFVGNKLAPPHSHTGRAAARWTCASIKAPIIVFASHGDDILAPPQQALNWIVPLYADEREIQARGQRIIYMVHKDIGHLGIFVSAKVALKEHDRIIGTLEASGGAGTRAVQNADRAADRRGYRMPSTSSASRSGR